ncbi:uncharacterized protein PHACADRAFT_181863 [Phanerochaete carnosa HHB-10118-sp]|uniref:Uncharacterized protein n=1 Tax=Phanerochaete carnosa (strain HHB-10118-sp) TaxID=650164 RepID=K5W7L1_PHACS|nr:uncharacterized protein PHACADRAFT_181863 [Phanerochaete carnosa HHB-10118-sp]EKM59928.1 hypothetical protein PHACADRAFT_181863 [Phanerochaete carnosa HHB-10118-sp]
MRRRAGAVRCTLTPEERAGLCRQYQAAVKRARDLATRLNEDIWVVGLPDEFLIEIFKWSITLCMRPVNRSAEIEEYGFDLSISASDIYGWLPVTQVCSRWRRVALGAATLWTRIAVISLDCVETFLRRSGQLPLDIRGEIYHPSRLDGFASWEPVFRQSHRIERLTIQDYNENYYRLSAETTRILIEGLPELPNLKKLKVAAPPDSWQVPSILRHLEERPPVSLESAEIFGLTLPDLRSWFSPNMTHLCLSNIAPLYEDAARLRMLLEILKTLPLLQTVKLWNGLPWADDPELEIPFDSREPRLLFDKPVSLPCLRLLHVASTSSDQCLALATLLANLEFPATAELNLLVVDEEIDTEEDLQALEYIGPALTKRLEASATHQPPAPVRALRLDAESDATAKFTGWKESLPSLAPMPYGAPKAIGKASPLFELSLKSVSARAALALFVPLLPLETIETLAVGLLMRWPAFDHHPLEECIWKQQLAQMPNIRTLCVTGASATFLPEALRPHPETETVPLPMLKQLELSEVAFLHKVPLVNKTGGAGEMLERNQWFEVFTGTLQARADLNPELRLEKIHINCAQSIREDDIEELEKYADEVIWDLDVLKSKR